jgi:FMN phosphatase YigB (HAD superfamily)
MVTNANKAKLEKQAAYPMVFLVDVDDTLLDNDRIQKDLQRHLESEYGKASRDRYWVIQEDLMKKLGYRDYLGALQQYRVARWKPRWHTEKLVCTQHHLLDY